MSFNGLCMPGLLRIKKCLDADQTRQRRIKLLGLSVAGSLVIKEMLVPDVTLSADKTKLIGRLVVRIRQKGKIYRPIFQLVELEVVFFRANTYNNVKITALN